MSTKSAHRLKALQVERDRLRSELALHDESVALRRRARAEDERRDTERRLRDIEDQIAALTAADIVVSEHALLRYVERVMGVDLEAVRRDILTEKNRAAIEFAGSCRIVSASGVQFVVKDRVVVSVVA